MNPRHLNFPIVLVSVLVAIFCVPPEAFAQNGAISLTVDATRTPQRFIPCTEVIPVKPGPLTLYYRKWIPGEHSPSGPIVDLTGLKFTANGQTIPWRRDLTEVHKFHLDVLDGVDHLDATFDYVEPSFGGMYGGSLSSTDERIALSKSALARRRASKS